MPRGQAENRSLTARQIARWRDAIAAAFALGGLSLATWGPRLPTLRADLRLSDGLLGVLISGVTVGSIAGLTCSSFLLARLGPGRGTYLMLWLAALGVSVIGISAGVFHSVPTAIVGFVCVGFGIGGVDVMINVEGSAVERAAGKTLMPLMHAAWSAGAVVGSGIGAGCAALGIEPQWQFLAESVVIAVVAFGAAQFIPSGERGEPHDVAAASREVSSDSAADPVRSRSFRQRTRILLTGWTDVRLLLIGLVMLGVELGEGSANNWLTLAVRDNHHQSDAIAALFFTAFAIGETIARVLGGPIVDRVGRVLAVRFTTALGVLGLLLFILAGPTGLILIGVVLWAVGVLDGVPARDVGGCRQRAESGGAGHGGGVNRLPGQPGWAADRRLPGSGVRAAERALAGDRPARRLVRGLRRLAHPLAENHLTDPALGRDLASAIGTVDDAAQLPRWDGP